MKIKIACAVDTEGKWNALGSSEDTPEQCLSWLMEDILGPSMSTHWIIADIPMPQDIESEIE